MNSDRDGPAAGGRAAPPARAEQASATGPAALHGRLLHVSRMATIGEMAAGVAHELNQPLTAITNYAHACTRLLARPNFDPAELREALAGITIQASRAAEIIGRLRMLARSHKSARVPLNINTVVAEIIGLIDGDARSQGVLVTLDLADALPRVAVDVGQIQHVVLNLVRNSLEALAARPPGSGRLQLRTSLTATGDVELAVLDNGPGVAREVAGRLFDPFFSTKEHGTGLGLAMSNTIARAHGGALGYRPNIPAGACFYVLLPVQAAV